MINGVEVEQVLLGTLLAFNDSYPKINGLVSTEDFFEPLHAHIFEVIKAKLDTGQGASPELIADYFRDVDEPGADKTYLQHLAMQGFVTNVEDYARQVRKHSNARLAYAKLYTVADELNKNPDLLADAVNEIAALLDMLRDTDTARRPIIQAGDAAEVAIAEIEDIQARRERGETLPYIRTGLAVLDREVPGFTGGQLIIIGGGPGMGKSALAMSIALAAAKDNRSVLFESLEMSEEEMSHRALSYLSGVALTKLVRATLEPPELAHIKATNEHLKALPLTIDSNGNVSVHTLRLDALELRRKRGLDMIVVDYLQLMSGTGENRTLEVGSITRGLKQLAMELNVPIVALSQLSRAVNSRDSHRPQLSDLRESGSIEQDANTVLLVHSQAYYTRQQPPLSGTAEYSAWLADLHEEEKAVEIIVAKQRQGKSGETVTVGWNKNTVSMENRPEDVPATAEELF